VRGNRHAHPRNILEHSPLGGIAQYVLGLLAAGIFLYGVARRIRRWQQGQPEKRLDHIGARLGSVVTQAILQLRTARDPYAGIMHLAVFWE